MTGRNCHNSQNFMKFLSINSFSFKTKVCKSSISVNRYIPTPERSFNNDFDYSSWIGIFMDRKSQKVHKILIFKTNHKILQNQGLQICRSLRRHYLICKKLLHCHELRSVSRSGKVGVEIANQCKFLGFV